MGAFHAPRIKKGKFFSKRESFFQKNRLTARSVNSKWFCVGGQGDNAFRAFAAAFLDNFMGKCALRGDTLQILLDKHFDYFPHHRSSLAGLQTSAERFQRLTIEVGMAELLSSLGYTFRQLAVNELLRTPETYREAFFNRYHTCEPEVMRRQNVPLDKSAMAALAHALRVPLLLQVVDNQKILPLCLHYNCKGSKPLITLQLQGEQYFSKLRHGERFKRAANQSFDIAPVVKKTDDPALGDILSNIMVGDEAIYEEFITTADRLRTMVNAGELTQNDLITSYIKILNKVDREHSVKFIGTEHGSEDFFAVIKQSINQGRPMALEREPQKDEVMDALIDAIARVISCGQASKEAFYEHIEGLNERPANQHKQLTN